MPCNLIVGNHRICKLFAPHFKKVFCVKKYPINEFWGKLNNRIKYGMKKKSGSVQKVKIENIILSIAFDSVARNFLLLAPSPYYAISADHFIMRTKYGNSHCSL